MLFEIRTPKAKPETITPVTIPLKNLNNLRNKLFVRIMN